MKVDYNRLMRTPSFNNGRTGGNSLPLKVLEGIYNRLVHLLEVENSNTMYYFLAHFKEKLKEDISAFFESDPTLYELLYDGCGIFLGNIANKEVFKVAHFDLYDLAVITSDADCRYPAVLTITFTGLINLTDFLKGLFNKSWIDYCNVGELLVAQSNGTIKLKMIPIEQMEEMVDPDEEVIEICDLFENDCHGIRHQSSVFAYVQNDIVYISDMMWKGFVPVRYDYDMIMFNIKDRTSETIPPSSVQ